MILVTNERKAIITPIQRTTPSDNIATAIPPPRIQRCRETDSTIFIISFKYIKGVKITIDSPKNNIHSSIEQVYRATMQKPRTIM